jgi:hypothetical protein
MSQGFYEQNGYQVCVGVGGHILCILLQIIFIITNDFVLLIALTLYFCANSAKGSFYNQIKESIWLYTKRSY